MNTTQKWLLGLGTTLSLGLAASAATAHPAGSEGGMKSGDMKHGEMKRDHAGRDAARALATPEERQAMREKMRAAATPEERQKIAAANHAEMQKRATEKGITLPESRGHRGMHGMHGMKHGAQAETPKADGSKADGETHKH